MTDNLNKGRVRDFFQTCTPLWCVVGEILESVPVALPEAYPFPLIVVSRYRDNIYILVCGVCETDYPILRCAVSAFLHVVYGIRVKWEPEGVIAVWGIGSVTVGNSFGLRRKGAVTDLDSAGPEWERWLGVGSTNSRQTWRSMFPSLLINSVWLSTTAEELRSNLRSLMWGIGVKRCQEPSWRGQLLRFFKHSELDRVTSIKELFAWV